MRTHLILTGTYATWFASQTSESSHSHSHLTSTPHLHPNSTLHHLSPSPTNHPSPSPSNPPTPILTPLTSTSPATSTSDLLMTVLGYVVAALTDPSLCLQAALALRNLCDANRKALAPQIGAFAELYAGLGSIPVCLSSFRCVWKWIRMLMSVRFVEFGKE
jgi:hypothetical protein